MNTFFVGKMDITPRDVACFLFAAGIHSLLFLWQGGLFDVPIKPEMDLGETLTSIEFRSDVPDMNAPAEGGATAARPKTFTQKLTSLFHGNQAKQEAPKPEMAMGQKAMPIEPPKSTWAKADALQNKTFEETKKVFQTTQQRKDDALSMSQQNKQIAMKPADIVQANDPSLKQSHFKVATRDVPFPILKPKSEELQNVNAIPMEVGSRTSKSVTAPVGGGMASAPAFQDKGFTSKSGAPGKSFGGAADGGSASGASGGLAMGHTSANSSPASASGFSSGSGAGSGNRSGDTTGAAASGRSWSGSSRGGSAMASLDRHTVTDDNAPATGTSISKNAGFTITGALAGRGIQTKTFAAYEMDARVALRFRVDWSGRVLDGIVVEVSSGSPSFDQKAIAALKQWVFNRLPSNRTNEIQEGVITFRFKGF